MTVFRGVQAYSGELISPGYPIIRTLVLGVIIQHKIQPGAGGEMLLVKQHATSLSCDMFPLSTLWSLMWMYKTSLKQINVELTGLCFVYFNGLCMSVCVCMCMYVCMQRVSLIDQTACGSLQRGEMEEEGGRKYQPLLPCGRPPLSYQCSAGSSLSLSLSLSLSPLNLRLSFSLSQTSSSTPQVQCLGEISHSTHCCGSMSALAGKCARVSALLTKNETHWDEKRKSTRETGRK